MSVYAKLCNVEILSSYIRDVSVGDVLTIQALITNPLDWQHFYEKLSGIKKGERTDFTVVTKEGDRLIGYGDVSELERWSDKGRFGFKIKIDVTKQKSLTDRRIRGLGKAKPQAIEEPRPMVKRSMLARELLPTSVSSSLANITLNDMNAFQDLLKDSLSMDIAPTSKTNSTTSSA